VRVHFDLVPSLPLTFFGIQWLFRVVKGPLPTLSGAQGLSEGNILYTTPDPVTVPMAFGTLPSPMPTVRFAYRMWSDCVGSLRGAVESLQA
jgi:hypothetical protein